MTWLLGVLIFFPFLTVIIAIHEAGHFFAARHYGMKVTEYFVGFGPWKLWSRRKGELEVGVKAIWAGGYVKIAGMNPYEENPPEDAPRLYGAKPRWQRAITIFAGPGTHFVLGALIFAFTFYFFGNVNDPTPQIGLAKVESTIDGEAAPASVAGLQVGDIIVSVGGTVEPTSEQLATIFTDQAEDRPGVPIDVTVDRNGDVIVVPVAPVMTTNEDGDPTGRIGVELQVVTTRMGPLTAIKEGVLEVGRTIEESIHQIGRVFSPAGISRTFGLLFNDQARDPTRDSTSVVGISQQVGSIGSDGDWAVLFYFFGFITVFIGLINLLPLPPFDGGHLAVLLIEKLRGGRAIDMRKLIPVSATVLAFFVTFVVATMILDVTKPFALP